MVPIAPLAWGQHLYVWLVAPCLGAAVLYRHLVIVEDGSSTVFTWGQHFAVWLVAPCLDWSSSIIVIWLVAPCLATALLCVCDW